MSGLDKLTRKLRCLTRGGGSCAHFLFATVGMALLVMGAPAVPGDDRVISAISFDRDIRPILSDRCFACHGADKNTRKGNLRLDVKAEALAAQGSYFAIVPGNVRESALYQRITAEDASKRMPPAHSQRTLTPEEIELLGRWIDEGAHWQDHWAFIPAQRPRLPDVTNQKWSHNAIDRFILARLEANRLSPSQEADPRRLIRRVTFDLTGLPPTPDEIGTFLADENPNAYERLVNRLLAKPQYGEHMARFWLDAARYADTHGLHLDNYREIWPYRDWVIKAFNENMPFDAFTVEQLAGDLLDEPTLEQRIATGFNRCNVTTSEGGSIDEEYYVRYAVDRTSTVSTVWMGLTMGCAVCHNHKFDPITQKEFYELYAYFNNITEKAMDGNGEAVEPVVKAPTAKQTSQLKEYVRQIGALDKQLKAPMPQVDAAQADWEATLPRWTVIKPQEFESKSQTTLELLDDNSILAGGKNPAKETYEIIARLADTDFTAIRFEGLTHESLPHKGAGRAGNSNAVLTGFEAEIATADQPESWQPIRFNRAWADHEQPNGDFKIGNAIDGKAETGWAIEGFNKRENRQAVFVAEEPFAAAEGCLIKIRLKHESRYAQHQFGRVRLATTRSDYYTRLSAPPVMGQWHALGPFPSKSFDENHGPEGAAIDLQQSFKSNDKELKWEKRAEYADGKVHSLPIESHTALYGFRTIHSQSPQQVTLAFGSDDGIKMWLNGQEILSKDISRGVAADQDQVVVNLTAGENQLLMKIVNNTGVSGFYFALRQEAQLAPPNLSEITALATADRTAEQAALIQAYYRSDVSQDETLKAIRQDAMAVQKQQADVEKAIPTTLVMQERDAPRSAYVLHRGLYTQRRQQVHPGTPAFLPSMPKESPPNRLGLARWLMDPAHPLTARVTVNRFWQQLFGTGIVATSENFGSQGQRPSHPELLDWLATEFIRSGWDVKYLLKLMVTSSTYRQSAQMNGDVLKRDPGNRLLSRGPRFRLDAEMIRDQALAISGLLQLPIGGPSVKPPQPDGLWHAVGYVRSNTARFVQDKGPDKVYRRSLYTFWKRTSPPPQMNILDAPSREVCSVRRERTNTPLQALMLMNDPQYVEAARALAQRIIKEGGATDADRLAHAFELATSRLPDDQESTLLLNALGKQLEEFESDPEAAHSLIQIGESAPDETLNPAQVAAWTLIANLLLNLDEVLTKG